MHVETGQAQYAHRVMDVLLSVYHRRSRWQVAATQKPATTATPGSTKRERETGKTEKKDEKKEVKKEAQGRENREEQKGREREEDRRGEKRREGNGRSMGVTSRA